MKFNTTLEEIKKSPAWDTLQLSIFNCITGKDTIESTVKGINDSGMIHVVNMVKFFTASAWATLALYAEYGDNSGFTIKSFMDTFIENRPLIVEVVLDVLENSARTTANVTKILDDADLLQGKTDVGGVMKNLDLNIDQLTGMMTKEKDK